MIFGHRQEFAGASAHYIVGKVNMAKEKTVFFCKECGCESSKWVGLRVFINVGAIRKIIMTKRF